MAEKSGKSARRQDYSCSFCGKSQEKVERLIAGPGGVYICNECIDLCNEIIADERATRANSGKGDHTPQARPRRWYQKKS